MATTLRSHAKINLGLYVGAPRPDGFHSLVTVYQTLELHDLVTVSAKPADQTTIRLISNDERVPTDSRNTAWKMAALILEELKVAAEVEIYIEKRLPVQGGLGAGSGNAVAALIGLEIELSGFPGLKSETWGTQFLGTGTGAADWPARQLALAERIGSDVPLFLIGGTILGLDRGQEVYPLPDIEPTWCVVAVPEVGVSTPAAFCDWDELCIRKELTPETSAYKLKQLSRAYADAFAGGISRQLREAGSSGVLSKNEYGREDLAGTQSSALVRTGISSWIENDFEKVVFPQHPSLAEIKRILAAAGTPEEAVYASLSGSGSALYGLYRTRGDAEAAQIRLTGAGVRSHLTRTLPRQAYWAEMLQEFEH